MIPEIEKKLVLQAPIPTIVNENISLFLGQHHDPISAEKLIYENTAFFSKLFGYSQYLKEIAVSHPGFVNYSLNNLNNKFNKNDFIEEVISYLDFSQWSKNKFLKIINNLKQREFMKIAMREILGISSLEEAVEEFSNLADSVLELLIKINYEQLIESYGIPNSEFCVIGLGKLGGRELNYSSDIDIIFVYEKDGETTKGISNSEFFDKLARNIIYDLNSRINGGFLFRVDTRLRPDGEFGALVRTEESYYNYYTERAETWEIQALIKSRLVGGNKELGKRFEKNINEIVYSTPILESDIAQILSIKEKIKGDEYNVKKCTGGIRDIEFITQVLQLIFGFKEESVRTQNTIKAINNLFNKGMINSDVEMKLKTSYIFLRRIENYIQLYNNLQDFSLPVKDSSRMSGIYRLLYYLEGELSGDEPEKLLQVFRKMKGNVLDVKRTIFQNFLEIKGGEEIILFLYNSDENDVRTLLGSYGLNPNGNSFNFISDIISKSTKGGIETSLGLKNLLRTVSKTKIPDLALSNIYNILDVTNNLPIAIQIFLDKNNVEFIGNIALLKEVFINILRKKHWIWDGTMDPEAFIDYLRGNIFHKFGKLDLGQFIEYTRDTYQIVLVSMALFRANNLLSTYESRRIFTEFYNIVFENFLKFIGDEFGIIRLGRWSTGELTFFSDLDVIYFINHEVHSDEWHNIKGKVEKIHNKLNEIFDIDTRLVEGSHKGSAFISDSTLKESILSEWQLIAYLRSSCLSKSNKIGNKVSELIFNSINSSITKDLDQKLHELRKKAIRCDIDYIDLKKGEGGLLDIEMTLCKLFYSTFRKVRREHIGTNLNSMIEFLKDKITISYELTKYINIILSVEDIMKITEKAELNDEILKYYANTSYEEFTSLRQKVIEWLKSEWK